MSATSHLWVLIHKHQGEIQALGPYATLGAAIIAAGVAGTFGWLQYRIGRDQRDIAKMKIRMDLHEKRYEVLTATRNLMMQSLSHCHDPAEFDATRRVVGTCRFLFPDDVADIIDQIDSACVETFAFEGIDYPSEDTLDKLHKAQKRVAQYLDQWPAPFGDVMAFKDVE